MAAADVLIPTYNRREALRLTLAGVAGQTLRDLQAIVVDRSAEPAAVAMTDRPDRRGLSGRPALPSATSPRAILSSGRCGVGARRLH